MIPNLNMQSFEQQHTPEGSEYGGRGKGSLKSLRRSETNFRQDKRTNQSLLMNSRLGPQLGLQTEFSHSDIDHEENKEFLSKERKILYRVSKKIYTPQEIELVRELVLGKRRTKLKKRLNYGTSIAMIISIFAMCSLLLFQIGRIWAATWEKNLASVSIQDPSIDNYVSTISVIRYFLYDNSSGSTITIGNTLAVRGETAYTDITTICKNSNVYIDEQNDVDNVEDSISNGIKLAADLFFIVMMLLCMVYIIYRTWKPIKVHRIPLVIRSNNVSPWSYKQRFKTATFALYMVISSLFVRYNMYDLSKDCIYCYDKYG